MTANTSLNRIVNYHSVVLNFAGNPSLDSCRILSRRGREIIEEDDVRAYGRTLNLIQNFLVHEARPWALINGDSSLLSSHVINQEQRDRITNEGLAVFMYEPLFVTRRGGGFIPEVFADSAECISDDSLSRWGCVELDSVLTFLNANKIFEARVTIYTCDYKIRDLLRLHPMYRSLNFETLDIYLVCDALFRRQGRKDFSFDPMIDKKFACLNYRYEAFRECVVAFLRQRQLHLLSNISFFHRHDPLAFQGQLFAPMEQMPDWPHVVDGLRLMQEDLPYVCMDGTRNEAAVDPTLMPIPSNATGVNEMGWARTMDNYRESFVAIANETRFFHRHGILTEKVTIPMVSYRPFLVVGSPHLLNYARELGFKTFSEFWDESYDTIVPADARMQAIFNLIDRLSEIPMRKMSEMLVAMKPILDHNAEFYLDEFVDRQISALQRSTEHQNVTKFSQEIFISI